MGKRGPYPGTGGRPRKALSDKILEGNPGKRPLTVVKLPSLEGSVMPEPRAYLSENQKNNKEFFAHEIFEQTWNWLKSHHCENLVTTQMLEQYAMSAARWIQCEECITEFGLLAKSPSSGNAIPSPFVAMSHSYIKQTNHLWTLIYQIVRENSFTEYKNKSPHDDMMEKLLTRKVT